MTKFKAVNNGVRDQAVRVKGGTVTVKSGATAIVEPYPPLDEQMLEHFSVRGLKFEAAKAGKAATDKVVDKVAAEKAGQLAEAQAAVQGAETALAVAEDDAAKTTVEQVVIIDRDQLTALKG